MVSEEIYITNPTHKFKETPIEELSECKNDLRKYTVKRKLMTISLPDKIIVLKPKTTRFSKYFELKSYNVFKLLERFKCQDKEVYVVEQTIFMVIWPVHKVEFKDGMIIFYDFVGNVVEKSDTTTLLRNYEIVKEMNLNDKDINVVIRINEIESEITIPKLKFILDICENYLDFDIMEYELRNLRFGSITNKINTILSEFRSKLIEEIEKQNVYDLLNYSIKELPGRFNTVTENITQVLYEEYGFTTIGTTEYYTLKRIIQNAIMKILVTEVWRDLPQPMIKHDNNRIILEFNLDNIKELTRSILNELTKPEDTLVWKYISLNRLNVKDKDYIKYIINKHINES